MDTLTMVSDDESCRQAGRLADELSSALIGLTDDITDAIAHAQRRIAEALDADRTTLIEFSGGAVREIYQWASDDVPPVDVHAHALRLTWLLDRSGSAHGTVALARIPDELPLEAATPGFLEHLREVAVRSAVLIPIAIAGERACVLVVETVRTERRWPAPLVARLRLLAEILTGALRRSRQEATLRHSQEEVARLIDSADTQFHRMLLMTAYATGVRRAELAHLQVRDIDSQKDGHPRSGRQGTQRPGCHAQFQAAGGSARVLARAAAQTRGSGCFPATAGILPTIPSPPR